MIEYIVGDATRPESSGPKIIAHCCNDIDKFGRGFVRALSKKWPATENEYHRWFKNGYTESGIEFKLGNVQFVLVAPNTEVANIIGQHGITFIGKTPPIRYDALREGLRKVGDRALGIGASVHCPRIGARLAGGKWDIIEQILIEELVNRDIGITVYTLESELEFWE